MGAIMSPRGSGPVNAVLERFGQNTMWAVWGREETGGRRTSFHMHF